MFEVAELNMYMTTVPQRHARQTDGRTDNIRWHYPRYCYCMARVKRMICST